MSIETPGNKKQIPTIELSEVDIALMSPAEIHELLCSEAEKHGVSREDLLYTGIDGYADKPFERGFGDRTTTWALDNERFMSEIAEQRHNSHGDSSPLRYVLDMSNMEPALLTLDARMFDSMVGEPKEIDDVEVDTEWEVTDDDFDIDAQLDIGHTDMEYRLKPGLRFDDAVVTALRVV